MSPLVLPVVRGDLSPAVLARTAVQRGNSDGLLERELRYVGSAAPAPKYVGSGTVEGYVAVAAPVPLLAQTSTARVRPHPRQVESTPPSARTAQR